MSTRPVLDYAKYINVEVGGFSGNLSSADDTVQKALATLDALVVGGAETDPVFEAWAIANDHHANWDDAYGWGDHSAEGYLTAETDPLSVHLDQTTPQEITASPILNWLSAKSIPYINSENELAEDSTLYFDDESKVFTIEGTLSVGSVSSASLESSGEVYTKQITSMTSLTIDVDSEASITLNAGITVGDINLNTISGNVVINGAYSLPNADGEDQQILMTDGDGTLSWVTAGGGSQTPWTGDIDADGNDLLDLESILFRNTTAGKIDPTRVSSLRVFHKIDTSSGLDLAPDSWGGDEIPQSHYTAMSYADNEYATGMVEAGIDYYGWMVSVTFPSGISASSIKSLTPYWLMSFCNGGSTFRFTLYIYNFNTESWQLVEQSGTAQDADPESPAGSTHELSATISTDIDHYIDGSNSVYMLIRSNEAGGDLFPAVNYTKLGFVADTTLENNTWNNDFSVAGDLNVGGNFNPTNLVPTMDSQFSLGSQSSIWLGIYNRYQYVESMIQIFGGFLPFLDNVDGSPIKASFRFDDASCSCDEYRIYQNVIYTGGFANTIANAFHIRKSTSANDDEQFFHGVDIDVINTTIADGNTQNIIGLKSRARIEGWTSEINDTYSATYDWVLVGAYFTATVDLFNDSGTLVIANDVYMYGARFLAGECSFSEGGSFSGTIYSYAWEAEGAVRLVPQDSPPTNKEEGTIYMDTDHHIYLWNGSAWKRLAEV